MSRLQKSTEIFKNDSDQCLQAFAVCQDLRNLASNSDVRRTYSFPLRSYTVAFSRISPARNSAFPSRFTLVSGFVLHTHSSWFAFIESIQ